MEMSQPTRQRTKNCHSPLKWRMAICTPYSPEGVSQWGKGLGAIVGAVLNLEGPVGLETPSGE